jgi:hypothetical protein
MLRMMDASPLVDELRRRFGRWRDLVRDRHRLDGHAQHISWMSVSERSSAVSS